MTATETDGAQRFLDQFADKDAIARYAEGPPRFLPGFDAMHRMTGVLLDEVVPAGAHLLVLGAGGGLEIDALARSHPGWRFTGIDPARPMLDLAEAALAPFKDRIDLIEGLIDDAPAGPFDGATCLLALHFLDRAERVRTLRAIRARLCPGAPFVAVHSSFSQDADARDRWLDRYAAFAIASGADAEQVGQARSAVAANLSLFTPAEDEAMIREAGFAEVEPFFAAFTWHGWIAHV
ncbi:class I SAM-dependent methyltransferase [Novosphingobium mangrovi (ex Huang et al. 2023)]|uniref:Class I SAM-dependent methyltransferase n=1 Tax=Novosphingobium mangrovi (ex Huang et al. 2023) TaxID=2976432 RepID=A0ABT2I4Z2_9SPHN|nr:class I SAM-dependent methyltransferase [Novosphingobium mangrovi (ex Huang et al. 2023)]MCT2399900.1 class I SAM-dependent methyltransferase [Novosphingobium mangrovi (ex Huang et al. 2023)]